MTDTSPEDVHEWISFADPHENRTWVFDATFLLSRWTCIYGRGCPGVFTAPAPEYEHGCCSYGAHFVDESDVAGVRLHADRLTDEQWQFKAVARKRGGFARQQKDGTWVTRLVEDACIFLNRPGFAGGAGCALHRAALEVGEEPLRWKPTVCWQLPLRQDDHTDSYGHVTSMVREWKRRDWGAGGFEFHWWCTDDDLAFVGATPVYVAMQAELTELIGAEVYELLATQLHAAESGRSTPLPHPAVRRRE